MRLPDIRNLDCLFERRAGTGKSQTNRRRTSSGLSRRRNNRPASGRRPQMRTQRRPTNQRTHQRGSDEHGRARPGNIYEDNAMERENDDVPQAEQSPAHDVLRNIRVSESDLGLILSNYLNRKGVVGEGYAAREAVCNWVVANQEELQAFLPEGFPREIFQESLWHVPLLFTAQALAVLAMVVALICLFLCWKYRQTKIMTFAQPIFLRLINVGFMFYGIGALTTALMLFMSI